MSKESSDKFKNDIVPALVKEFGYKSVMQVPRLKKVVINMGVGDATSNSKAIQFAEYCVKQLSGQKPVITRAKKAISTFKLKENQAIGCMVTLRGEKMWSFFKRLTSVALPRVRDFRGVSKSFNGGSYTLGLKELIVFPEIDIDKLDKVRGANFTFVTTAKTGAETERLLALMGMPFRK
jgi:large subunit ribosomal protein L5